jgi:hypothetical protein
MLQQTLEAAWNLGVPFPPVVAARLGVELIGEMVLAEPSRKSSVGFEQRFPVSGSEIEVRSDGRVR